MAVVLELGLAPEQFSRAKVGVLKLELIKGLEFLGMLNNAANGDSSLTTEPKP